MPVQRNYFNCEWGGGACAFPPLNVRPPQLIQYVYVYTFLILFIGNVIDR